MIDPKDQMSHAAVHEAGHAAARLHYKLPIGCVSITQINKRWNGNSSGDFSGDPHIDCNILMAGIASQQMLLGCTRADSGINDIGEASKKASVKEILGCLEEICMILETYTPRIKALAEKMIERPSGVWCGDSVL